LFSAVSCTQRWPAAQANSRTPVDAQRQKSQRSRLGQIDGFSTMQVDHKDFFDLFEGTEGAGWLCMAFQLEPLTERIIACGIEVHRILGAGLPESCCEAALAIEMKERGLAFLRQPIVPIFYSQVVLELKCVATFEPVFTNQMLTYLKSTKLKVGLFMNFHMPTLKAGLKRYVL
jgi:hypothetical protein